MRIGFFFGEVRRIYKEAFASLVFIGITALFLSVLLNLFIGGYVYTNNITRRNSGYLKARVYLKEDTPHALKDVFALMLRYNPYVDSLKFIDKKKAEMEFQKNFPEFTDLIRLFESNPLPENYELFLNYKLLNPKKLGNFKKALLNFKFVDEVYLQGLFVFRLYLLEKIAYFLLISFIIVFFFILSMITRGSIRAAVEKKKDLIKVYWLLGGNTEDIIGPFQVAGLISGLLGSIFASLVLYLPFAFFTVPVWTLGIAPGFTMFTIVIVVREVIELSIN